MKITFDEYIQNPMGKENAVISNRTMYRNLYVGKLNNIMLREGGNITYKAYNVGKRYICYLKIPSEVVKDFYYDVLIEFTPPKGKITGTTLKDYTVRFYSNDPSFVYTFAHAFIKNGLFFSDYADKMSKKAIKDPSKVKNPQNQVGYVKSLYFAYLIMTKRGLFSKLRYVDIYSEKAVKREVMNADEKIELRQEATKSNTVQHKKEKESIKKIASPGDNISHETPIKPKKNIGKVKTVGKGIKSIGSIGSIKKTKKK